MESKDRAKRIHPFSTTEIYWKPTMGRMGATAYRIDCVIHAIGSWIPTTGTGSSKVSQMCSRQLTRRLVMMLHEGRQDTQLHIPS